MQNYSQNMNYNEQFPVNAVTITCILAKKPMLLSASLRPESGHTAKGRQPRRRPARRPMHRPEELKPNQPLRAPAQPPGERAVKVTAASTSWVERASARARPPRPTPPIAAKKKKEKKMYVIESDIRTFLPSERTFMVTLMNERFSTLFYVCIYTHYWS